MIRLELERNTPGARVRRVGEGIVRVGIAIDASDGQRPEAEAEAAAK